MSDKYISNYSKSSKNSNVNMDIQKYSEVANSDAMDHRNNDSLRNF